MKTAERNRARIAEMMESVARDGILSQVEYFAEESTNHGFPSDRAAIRGILEDIKATFPDVGLDTSEIVADGDWVAVRCFLHGTHLGTGRHPFVHHGLLAGVPPTGRKVRVQHIHMFRLEGGQIVEHWATRDDVDMMRQLGLPA
jgi:predicted ester cyclase